MRRRRVVESLCCVQFDQVRTGFECALTSYWLARSRLSFKHPIHVLSGQMAEMATSTVRDHQVDHIGFYSCHCGTMVQRRPRGLWRNKRFLNHVFPSVPHINFQDAEAGE